MVFVHSNISKDRKATVKYDIEVYVCVCACMCPYWTGRGMAVKEPTGGRESGLPEPGGGQE